MRVLVRCCRKVRSLAWRSDRKTIRLDRNGSLGRPGASTADLRMYTLPRGIRQRDDLRSYFP